MSSGLSDRSWSSDSDPHICGASLVHGLSFALLVSTESRFGLAVGWTTGADGATGGSGLGSGRACHHASRHIKGGVLTTTAMFFRFLPAVTLSAFPLVKQRAQALQQHSHRASGAVQALARPLDIEAGAAWIPPASGGASQQGLARQRALGRRREDNSNALTGSRAQRRSLCLLS